MQKRLKIRMGLIITIIIIVLVVGVGFFFYIRHGLQIDKKDVSDDIYYQELNPEKIIYSEDIGRIVSDELIIETSETDEKNFRDLCGEEGGRIVGYIAVTDTYQVEFPDLQNTDELEQKKLRLEQNDVVEHVSYNYVIPSASMSGFYPNDKKWKRQWDDDMKDGNWGMKAIHAPEAWKFIKDKNQELKTVEIGLFEAGDLYSQHEDLKNNIDNISGSSTDEKTTAHGTEVAGIIGAEFDNNLGITGVMMNNVELDYFSYGSNSNSNMTALMKYKAGLSYLITHTGDDQTAVINCSFGIEQYAVAAAFGNAEDTNVILNDLNSLNEELSQHLKKLIDRGYDFLLVKAAGNSTGKQYIEIEDGDLEEGDNWSDYGFIPYSKDKKSDEYQKYSSLYKKYQDELDQRLHSGEINAQHDIFSGITDAQIKNRIIVVGGSSNPDGSDYPLYSYSCRGDRVDITAPATNLQSTKGKNDYEKGLNGTSFSAPYVSGVAGLALTVKSDLTGEELKTALIESGIGSYSFGIGATKHMIPMVNAKQAVQRVNKFKRNKVVDIKYEYKTEDSDEYAVITAVNNLGLTIWNYTTDKHSVNVVPMVSEIGRIGNLYCFADNGTIKALRVSDGSVVWENAEYSGSVTDYIIGKDKTLYISGYYGPDFFAVDKNGKTLCRITTMNEQFYWPYEMEYQNAKIRLDFEQTSIEDASNAYALIDLRDYSYQFFYDLPEPEPSITSEEGYCLYYDPNHPEDILEIYSSDSEKVIFTAFWYRIGDLYKVTADWNGETAVFKYTNPETQWGGEGTLSLSGNDAVLTLTKSTVPYIDPGTYTYKIGAKRLSDAVIEETRQWLEAPENAEAEAGDPIYSDAEGCFTTHVSFKLNGEEVAGADVDSLTGEVLRNILKYSG